MAERVSDELRARAERSMPGGVNSPVRTFTAVQAPPFFADRGAGPHLYDADGRRYVDHLMGWGAVMLGHAYPAVRRAICRAAERGTGFGLSAAAEADLAELIRDAFPSVELVRLVNSGTEAVMSAVRLARGYTGRAKVIAFEGGYHGHSDGLLARAGSGLATLGLPASAGVPPSFTAETLLARYNDLDSVRELCATWGEEVACVLVEPVAGNMGVVPPAPGFLQGLREVCDRTGALLIFDEVITGFRIAWGGAQERYGVRADVTTLGKIIGGGLPVGAFGGRGEVMERLAPLGDVYQAGTLSGNPLVAAAGAAVLRELRRRRPYEAIEGAGRDLAEAMLAAACGAALPLRIGRVGGMFTPFFTEEPVTDYASARRADGELYGRFFRALLARGVLPAPSPWESAFVSACHLRGDVLAVSREAVADSLRQLAATAPL